METCVLTYCVDYIVSYIVAVGRKKKVTLRVSAAAGYTVIFLKLHPVHFHVRRWSP
jgi:hypothetical protein